MKRKLLTGILMITMAITLAGCGKSPTPQGDAQDEAGEKEASQQSETGDEADEELTESGQGHVLWAEGSDIIYVVDDDGKKLDSFDLSQIRKKSASEGFRFENFNLKAVSDGVLYFSEYMVIPGYDKEGDVIYAVDGKTGETATLWTEGDEDDWISHIDIYDGDLYVLISSENSREELRFIRDGESMEFEQVESDYDDLLKAAGDNDWSLYCSSRRYDGGSCTEMLDTYGYLLAYDGESKGYMGLYPDGGVKVFDGMPADYVNICGYDDRYLIYTETDDIGQTKLCRYDLENGSIMDMLVYNWQNETYSVIGLYGDVIYLTTEEGEEYSHEDKVIEAIDVNSGEMQEICRQSAIAGASTTLLDPQYAFELIGDDVYTTTLVGADITWSKVNGRGRAATHNDIDCPIMTISGLQYGTIDYVSGEDYCPYCGIPLYKYYTELFQLDREYSDQAEKINDTLRASFDFSTETAESGQALSELTDEECEYHQEYPNQYCETDDTTVSDVYVIADRYLAVNMGGYWYGGGAHGYPTRNQYLFDLTTGDQLGVRDFYDGSNEEFKQLCADATMADYNQYSEYESPYFAEDAQAVYDQAYEEADLDASYIEFREDGAYLVYFPYDIGPYSSGFIEIKILNSFIYN